MGRYRDRWESRQERWERRRNRRHSATGGFFIGAIIVAAGTVMLLDNLGVIRARDIWGYLPLALVALGVVKIFECQGRPAGTMFGGLIALAGGLWFLSNIDVLRFDSRLVGPILIIGLGLTFLVRAIERQRELAANGTAAGIPDEAGPAQANIVAVFSGHKRVLETRDFRSADLFAVFGGIELDLRRSGMTQDSIIDANAIFGGIEIKVPQNWVVDVHGNGIFGGYEDKTIHPVTDPNVPAPRLVVTGFAIFGGISVSNG